MIAHASNSAAPGKPGRVNLIGAGVSFDAVMVETDAYAGEGIRRGDVLQLRGGHVDVGNVLALDTGPGAESWDLARVVSQCPDRVGLVWFGRGEDVRYHDRATLRVRGVVTTLLRKEV